MGVAVEHGDDGHALLVRAHQRLDPSAARREAREEQVRAGRDEHAGADALRGERARRRHRLGHHHPRREQRHRVVLGIPAGLAARVEEAVATREHGLAQRGARGGASD